MVYELRVLGIEEFIQVSRAMKQADPLLRKEMFKTMRETVTKPIIKDMRANATGMNISGTGSRGPSRSAAKKGLRHRIAMSVRSTIRDTGRGGQVGVKIDSVPKKITDAETLGVYTNIGRWRHPVFARPHKTGRIGWTTSQASPPGWFDKAAEEGVAEARAQFQQTLAEFTQRLSAMM